MEFRGPASPPFITPAESRTNPQNPRTNLFYGSRRHRFRHTGERRHRGSPRRGPGESLAGRPRPACRDALGQQSGHGEEEKGTRRHTPSVPS